jgi:two-component system phosphate regulon response regulator PhoB
MRNIVLIVESNVYAGKLFKSCLERGGQHVVLATSADAGLHMARLWQPDLTIIDLDLPHGAGSRLLDQLAQERPRQFPMLAMSARDGTDALPAGSTDTVVLAKPIQPERLTALVGSLLENRPVPADSPAEETAYQRRPLLQAGCAIVRVPAIGKPCQVGDPAPDHVVRHSR